MEKEELWGKFNALAAEAQREVIDFMDFLHTRYGHREVYEQSNEKKFEAGSNGNNGRHFSFSKGMEVLGTRVNVEAEIPADRRFKL
ncbi:MAG: hypothetical protein HC887_11590 [Desulfobacteraceae bacterium]|nr:hypothetical protein [Desulfobacteraceae bacterium]